MTVSNVDQSVGIGTVAPTQKLDVRGNTFISGQTKIVSDSGLFVSGSRTNYGIIEAFNMSDEPLLNLHSNRSGFGPTIRMIGMDTTGDLGGISFQAPPKNSYWHTYARMGTGISSTTTDEEEGYIKFQTSQDGSLAEVMRIDGNGRVGIGTDSPSQKLQLKGDSTYFSILAADGSEGVSLGTASSGRGIFYLKGATGGNAIYIDSNGDSYLDGGNVAIGATAADSNRLLVDAASADQIAAFGNNNAYVYIQSPNAGESRFIQGTADTGYLTYYTRTGGSNYERMRLTNAGNVGIGSIAPVAKLEVSGAIALSSGSITSAPGYTSLWASGSGLYWGSQAVATTTPGASDIEGNLTNNYLPIATNTNTVGDYVLAKSENRSMWIGSNPGGTIEGSQNDNVALGYNALDAITSGAYNTAIGGYALSAFEGEAGLMNTAVGYEAGLSLVNGYYNTYIGSNAGRVLTSGDKNTSIGYDALGNTTAGNKNVAVGFKALRVSQAGNTTAIGYQALTANVVGDLNTAVGWEAGISNVSGSHNVFVGHKAGHSQDGASALGHGNVYVGYQSALLNTSSYSVILGSQAGENATSLGNSVIIGRQAAGAADATGDYNVLIGYKAGYDLTTGVDNVGIGREVLENITSGSYNTAVGRTASYALKGGHSNVSLGYGALYNDVKGGKNIAIGYNSLLNCAATTFQSGENIAIGYQSGYDITTGIRNIIIGSDAGQNLTTNDNGVIIGYKAAYNTTAAAGIVAIGSEAMQKLTSGANNTAVGEAAGYFTTSGSWNTSIGRRALFNNTRGDKNIAIGNQAGFANTTGTGNVFIGYYAGQDATATDSNKLFIANAAGTPLIGGDFSADEIYLNGDVGIGTTAPGFPLVVSGNQYDLVQFVGADEAGVALDLDANGTNGANWRLQSTADNAGAGAGKLTFAEDGNIRMTLQGGGNVGIGTTSPSTKLDVVNATSNWGMLVDQNNTGNVALRVEGNYGLSIASEGQYPLNITTTGGGKLRMLNSGFLGLGTDSPRDPLDIVDDGDIKTGNDLIILDQKASSGSTNNNDTASAILWRGYSSDSSSIKLGRISVANSMDMTNTDSTQDSYMTFQTSLDGTMTEYMRINESGNVGIGTDAPDRLLHIHGASNTYFKMSNDNTGQGGSDGFEMIQDSADINLKNREAGAMTFGTSGDTRMTIDSAGDVGIGTASPAQKLDVAGATQTGDLIVTGSTLAVQQAIKNDISSDTALSNSYNRYFAQSVSGDGAGDMITRLTAPASPTVGDEYFIVASTYHGPGPCCRKCSSYYYS